MAEQYSATVRNAILDAMETSVGTSAILKLRTGNPPADCATADSGTMLADDFGLASDWMAAASGGSKAKNGTWQDTSADASGIAGHYRLYASDGTTCHWQGHCSEPWTASKAYILNQKVNLGGNIYICATAGTSAGSGGPTGTGSGITDGSVTWNYVAAHVSDLSMDNTIVNAGQSVTIGTWSRTAPGA